VTDTIPLSDEQVLTIRIKDALKPPVIITDSLPGGQVGDAYNAELTATSTNGAVTWRLIPAGAPAPGLQLVGATITGTPTTKGTFEFTVRATDAAGLSDEKLLFVQINDRPNPPIITTTLPGGTVNVAYIAQLTSTGGTGAVTWSVIPPGDPAPGLTLNGTTGAITGTPTKSGSFSVRVRATDTTPLSSEKVLTLTIQDPPIRPPDILTESLPAGRVGDAYNAQLTATTPNGPVTWSVPTLPDGLALNRTSGAITGTPTAAGNFDVTVRATDPLNRVDEQALSLQIRALPPRITTTSLPGGTVGNNQKWEVNAVPGIGDTWSITGGTLPPGLEFKQKNILGILIIAEIFGTPTKEGIYKFTVRITDTPSGLSDSRDFSITIAPELTIKTTALPESSADFRYNAKFERDESGQFRQVSEGYQLEASGGVGSYTWEKFDGALPDGITLTSGGYISGKTGCENARSYLITFRVKDGNGVSASKQLTLPILGCIN